MHTAGNVSIFVLLKFEKTLDREIIHFIYNSNHHDKCKFALKLTKLLTVSNLFPLEVVRKFQGFQLCVL